MESLSRSAKGTMTIFTEGTVVAVVGGVKGVASVGGEGGVAAGDGYRGCDGNACMEAGLVKGSGLGRCGGLFRGRCTSGLEGWS